MQRLSQVNAWRNSCTRCRLVRCTSIQNRTASTSANPYPFPANSHPTPHQIFHLPKSATRADVKARYYDLVRIYHPDSPAARAGGVPPEVAHARFQAISSAYAILSGKRPAGSGSPDGADSEGFAGATRASYHDLSTAMWRARQRRRAELDVGMDERWKERIMMGAVLMVSVPGIDMHIHPLFRTFAVALFVLQTYTTRSKALSEARHQRRTTSSKSLDGEPSLGDRKLSLDNSSPASSS
ncbi:hypothetical protein C8Q76DRAFT_604359 [Earliella scabrosa]|nr:hypothetical protein C8Q76DRAFT_604359 [Earliella scabrosa]